LRIKSNNIIKLTTSLQSIAGVDTIGILEIYEKYMTFSHQK
jgi:hypothetical protein